MIVIYSFYLYLYGQNIHYIDTSARRLSGYIYYLISVARCESDLNDTLVNRNRKFNMLLYTSLFQIFASSQLQKRYFIIMDCM